MTTTPVGDGLVRNRGWTVAMAGMGINLALGVLYTWSMFKGAIEATFGWTRISSTIPTRSAVSSSRSR
jgi:hypothetical protein